MALRWACPVGVAPGRFAPPRLGLSPRPHPPPLRGVSAAVSDDLAPDAQRSSPLNLPPPCHRRLFRPACGAASVALLVFASGCGSLVRNENAEGVKLYQQGNYLGAVNHFQQALAQQPGSADCFYNLGATYHQQAKVFYQPSAAQTAEQYYHLCLARNPDHDACQRALAVLLVEENRSPEAVARLEDWSRRQPTNPNPQIELARLFQEHGDNREAENHLIDALAIAPSNPRALVALGQLRETSGDTGQALANYSRALAADGQQPVVAARVASLGGGGAGTVRMAALPPSPPLQPLGPGFVPPPPIAPSVTETPPFQNWSPAAVPPPGQIPEQIPEQILEGSQMQATTAAGPAR